jgi:hypothetical protein
LLGHRWPADATDDDGRDGWNDSQVHPHFVGPFLSRAGLGAGKVPRILISGGIALGEGSRPRKRSGRRRRRSISH